MIISEPLLKQAMQPENRSRFDPKEVRLSSIGYCQRRQVLTALEGAPPIDWGYDQHGHLLQEALSKIIERKYPITRELEVKHDYGIAHIDLFIEKGILSDVGHICEIKTIKCAALAYELPKPAHILQVQGQMLFLSRNNGYIPTAEIIYMCRDDAGAHHQAHEIAFPDPERTTFIEDRLRQVYRYIEEKFVPEVPFDEPIYECSYKTKKNGYGKRIEYQEIKCPFYESHCWGNHKPK